MKILIDIGHPAHVHYFKNFIKMMEEKGHLIIVTARNKEVTIDLLKKLKIKYFERGKGAKSIIGKLFYVIIADLILLKVSLKYKPDIFLSFGSPYPGHIAKLFRKHHIAFTDTEHAKLAIMSIVPFSNIIQTPYCYFKDLGEKQIKFNSFMELCALNPKYFKPDIEILNLIGINKSERLIFLRFVSWNANHDIGQSGLSIESKLLLVKELSKLGRILISSEGNLPKELQKYQISISPDKIHDLLYFTDLYIGEGATMASECAMLGTPAIYVNSLDAGTLQEQEKLGLIYQFRNSEGVLEKAITLLNNPNLKEQTQDLCEIMIKNKIDLNTYMVWFFENYPKSVQIMKDNPDYQFNFI